MKKHHGEGEGQEVYDMLLIGTGEMWERELWFSNVGEEVQVGPSDYELQWSTSLENLKISKGVTSIGKSAFNGCETLASVTIPSSVAIIEDMAFCGCDSLASVTIPSSVTNIGDGAFATCTALTSITIREGVTSIENNAFMSCTDLISVTIPSSVTSIGAFAFQYCSNLTSVIIDSEEIVGQFTEYNSVGYLADLSYTRTIYIKEGITTIGSYIQDNYEVSETKDGYVKYVRKS